LRIDVIGFFWCWFSELILKDWVHLCFLECCILVGVFCGWIFLDSVLAAGLDVVLVLCFVVEMLGLFLSEVLIFFVIFVWM